MDWSELIKLVPIVAGSIDPRAGEVATLIEQIANTEIRLAMDRDPSKTREQVIEEAGADWERGLAKARELRQLGHEGEG